MVLSSPSCGDTSRSVRTFSARVTSGIACSIGARSTRTSRPDVRRGPPAARARAHQVLVGDELVAVALHDAARELPAADDEDLLVVLLQLLDEADEVAVAADDHEGVDVGMGERHLERVEREVDVRAVLVAARREVALHHLDGVLGQRAAVAAGALPVAVGGLGHDVAALLEGFEHEPGVERAPRVFLTPISMLSKSMNTAIRSRSVSGTSSSVLQPLS